MLSTIFAQNQGTINIAAPGGAGNVEAITIGGIISWAFTAVLILAAVIFFFMLIIGGLRWIISGGDKAATESARSQITAALIGLIIVFGAWAIANLIGGILGVNLFEVISNGFGTING